MENSNLRTYSLTETPHYKVHGRTIPGICPLPLFFNGSAIEVNVTGTELWVNITVEYTSFEIWVASEINGAFMSRQMLMPGTYDLCLFRSMSPEAIKNIKFTRELQAMTEDENCSLVVNGF
ncbi:MAG: GDSL family lipase, partial [Lachnospiraceae bacterium]|nr:GDSL family lipase [Lachnospiraceae bacterium]